MHRRFWTLAFAFGLLLIPPMAACAQTVDLQHILGPTNGATSGRIIQLLLGMTVLSLAPGLLMTVTCFTRFVIAFSFLRAGLGLPTTPANIILISLSLFMTFFVMAPVFDRSWEAGVKPLVENKISEREALPLITAPFRDFMLTHVREKDLKLFAEAAGRSTTQPADAKAGNAVAQSVQPDLRVVVPAFMVSELRRGFEIGFLILLPFLIIDLIVATLTMSMGMMMLSPTVISLPFKVLFFVLIDGWHKIVGSLLRSVI
jgi:flagellar biosynthesis protein FliP